MIDCLGDFFILAIVKGEHLSDLSNHFWGNKTDFIRPINALAVIVASKWQN